MTRYAAARALPVALVLCLLPRDGAADEAAAQPAEPTSARVDTTRWLRDAGIGFRVGGAYQESAFGREWEADLVLGPEIEFAVVYHYLAERDLGQRAGIGAGYLYLRREIESGTAEVWTRTRYQRIDIFAGYDLVWKLLVAGARVGTALTLIEVRTTHGRPTAEVADPETLEYIPNPDPDIKTRTGASPGFLVGLGVGLAFGRYLFGIDDLIELRFQSDYVRRGERDDFYLWGMLSFWPTALVHREKHAK